MQFLKLSQQYNWLKEKNFRLLCLMSGFFAISVGIAYVSMSWYVSYTYGEIKFSIIFVFFWWIFAILLTPVTGYLSDKFSKRNIIILSHVLRILLLLLYSNLSKMQSLFDICFFSALWGAILAFYIPAINGLLVEIFYKTDNLVYSNAFFYGVFEVGLLLGMFLGGILIAYINLCYILNILLVLNLFSLLLMFFIDNKVLNVEKEPFINSWYLLVKYMKNHKFLYFYYAAQIGFSTLFMTIPIFLPLYVNNILSGNSIDFGMLEGSFSISFILGSIFLPFMSKKYKKEHIVSISLYVSIGIYLFLLINTSIIVAIIAYSVLGICISCWSIVITMSQQFTDLKFQGQAQGTIYGLSGLLMLMVCCLIYIIDKLFQFSENLWFIVMIILACLTLYCLDKACKSNKEGKIKC